MEDPEIPVVARRGAKALAQGVLLAGVSGQSGPQVEHTAEVGGIEGVGQSVVEGAFQRDAHPGDDIFQLHPLAFLAGVLPQKELLQVVPDRRAALVEIAEEKVLLEHRHVIHAPLGELGVRAAPLHKTAEALDDGFTLVEVLLRQTGDFGDVVLQAAEDAGTQVDGEGIQHVGVLVDLNSTDFNDLPSERLLDAVIIKDKRLIADVPLQIE